MLSIRTLEERNIFHASHFEVNPQESKPQVKSIHDEIVDLFAAPVAPPEKRGPTFVRLAQQSPLQLRDTNAESFGFSQ